MQVAAWQDRRKVKRWGIRLQANRLSQGVHLGAKLVVSGAKFAVLGAKLAVSGAKSDVLGNKLAILGAK